MVLLLIIIINLGALECVNLGALECVILGALEYVILRSWVCDSGRA